MGKTNHFVIAVDSESCVLDAGVLMFMPGCLTSLTSKASIFTRIKQYQASMKIIFGNDCLSYSSKNGLALIRSLK